MNREDKIKLDEYLQREQELIDEYESELEEEDEDE